MKNDTGIVRCALAHPFRALVAVAALAAAGAASAVPTIWRATYTDEVFQNHGVTVVATFTFDPATTVARHVGGGYVMAGGQDISVVVTGSVVPAANDTWTAPSFDWLILSSNTAPAFDASLWAQADLALSFGSNGSANALGNGCSPSINGNAGQMAVGSGGGMCPDAESVSMRSLENLGPVTGAVPEPGSWAMAGLGGALLLAWARRRRAPRAGVAGA